MVLHMGPNRHGPGFSPGGNFPATIKAVEGTRVPIPKFAQPSRQPPERASESKDTDNLMFLVRFWI